jgi:ABC-type cobalamin/Fe3+-siderophores transport system ATPase subunit
MRIQKIDLPKSLQLSLGLDVGLGDIRMNKLDSVVVLAGANGSGKSRLLRLLADISQKPRKSVADAEASLAKSQDNLKIREQQLEANRSASSSVLLEYQRYQSNAASEVEAAKRELQFAKAVETDLNGHFTFTSYSIENSAITDPEELPPSGIRARVQQIGELGTSRSHEVTGAYLKDVMVAGFNAMHQDPTTAEAAALVERRDSLVALLKTLLGESLAPKLDLRGSLELFGRKDFTSSLSDGQRMLLKLGCAIHAQNKKLESVLLALDEPEKHLHPSALVYFIDKLCSLVATGQIWIATHSLPLIAHIAKAAPHAIWYANAGDFENAGRRPELVISGLLGGEDGARAIQDFTLLPGRLAMAKFLSECLIPPGVADADSSDPQTRQIAAQLHALLQTSGKTKLRVLDFGAGKGRLISTIPVQSGAANGVPEWLDYYALEPDAENRSICDAEIVGIYGPGSRRAFSTIQEIKEDRHFRDFDVVVLSNVLHELKPESWPEYFGPTGSITTVLKPDGALLLMEDMQIPIGELAHDYGFFLLDSEALRVLFGWKDADEAKNALRRITPESGRYKDRLVIHLVRRDLLERVSPSTVHDAVTQLKRLSGARMAKLKNTAQSYADGHSYALAAQSFANAVLWLDDNQAPQCVGI